MIEKILNIMNSIPHDKSLHGFYGLTLYSTMNIFIYCWVSIIIIILLAVAKELYDGRNSDIHTKETFDAVATFIVPLFLCVVELLYIISNGG